MGRTVKTKSKVEVINKQPPVGVVIHIPVMTPVRKINPAAYNPRKISQADFDSLKTSIKTYGFIDPVCIRREGMCLIGGHQRVKALKEVCSELGVIVAAIPAIVLDVDDRSARKLNVMLNNVGGEFDARLLGQLLAGMNEEQPLKTEELSFMGLEQDEADKYLRLVDAIPPLLPHGDEVTTFANSVTLSIEFNDVRLRDATKKALLDKSSTTGQKTGDFIAALLGCRVPA